MGLRGPNAKPIKKRDWINPVKRVVKQKRKVLHPWDAFGLSRSERVIVFLETLPISSGILSGQTFKVQDWQRREIIEPIYATDENGKRIVREAFISIPRKNGKTGLIAGLSLCHLCGPEAVERGQIVSAAGDIEQSALVFDEMCAAIERVEWMNNRILVKSFTKQLEDVETGTKYKALSSESKTKFGKSPCLWIYDELAQAPDSNLYSALATATGAWPEPLGIVISTQNSDPNHIMTVLYDDSEQIIKGLVHDPTKHACIYSAPIDQDPWSEETWRACNPALGVFRSLEDIQAYALKARRMPSLEASFRLLFLNQRVSAEHRFVPLSDWDACGTVREKRHEYLKALKGKTCYGAVDLSSSGKNDLTSLVLIFPLEDKVRAIIPFFWACESTLEEAEKRDRVPYRLWVHQGHLLTIPRRILDYGFIAEKLAEIKADYDLKAVAFDPWKIKHLVQACEDIHLDLTMVPHAQSFKDMDQSIQILEDDILSWQLKHDSNPLMSLCMDNIKIELDSTGNRKFSKRKSTGRIDGAVALAMAEGLIASQPQDKELQIFFVG
jgi:Phage terminase-like protein, large subunit